MSESTNKAVFLSYASQDAEAAKRIADALRAAGVEVWFDQSELMGGDVWDAKIKRQIKECALFVPIISANTQARTEGYFRLEWRLGDQRTHLMAKGRPFLMPVVIDDTRDVEAHVPDSFNEVHWTRLKGGETPPAFAARVKKLLSGETLEAGRLRPAAETQNPEPRTENRRLGRWWWALPIFGVAMALLLVMKESRKEQAPLAAPSGQPAVASASATELARVRARIIPDHWQKSDFEAVSVTLDRLIQADPENADAWALRSIINSLQVTRNADAGTTPLNAGKAAAERSLRIAPGNPLGELALGLHHVTMISRGGDVQAARVHIERGVAGLPPDALTRYAELVSYWLAFQFAETERCARVWLAAEPSASFPAWILAQMNLAARHPAEAVQWAEKAAADQDVTGVRALATMFEARYYLQADLPGARAALDRQTVGGRTVHRVVFARWLLAMAERRWDTALQELARLPEPILFDRNFHGPKALLAGLAQRAAGHPEAMAAQFRESERLSREEMSRDPDNEELHAVLALTLACTGHAAEARAELAAIEPLMGGRAPNVYAGQPIVLVAQTHAELGEPAETARWLRKLFVEPSIIVFTPASLRLDARFAGVAGAPEIQALLAEFASLDQPVAQRTENGGQKTAQMVDQKSVAVLPFANLSGDPAQEYFSDGLTDEILTTLSTERDLRVVARTSAFAFKGKSMSLAEIARALNVAQVVEGSVRKSGNTVKITVSLTRVSDGFSEPLGTFTEKLDDIFALQEKVARAVVEKLTKRTVTVEGVVVLTKNPEAYDLYLKARAERRNPAIGSRLTLNSRDASIYQRERLLQAAVTLDPSFAAGWAELASTQSELYNNNVDRSAERLALMKASVDHAVRLAPEMPEVLSALGRYHLISTNDYPRAAEQFEKRIRLQPNNAEAYYELGVVQRRQGRWAAALDNFQKTSELDPGNPGTMRTGIIRLLEGGRRYEEAARWQRRLVAQQPDSPAEGFNLAYLPFKASGSTREMEAFLAGLKSEQESVGRRRNWAAVQGHLAEAIGDRQLVPDDVQRSPVAALNFAILLAASGDRPGARAVLAEHPAALRSRLEREPDNLAVTVQLARIEALLGHADEALRAARKAMELMPESVNPWDNTSARAALAFVYAWAGDKDRAIAEYAKLLRSVAPDSGQQNVYEMKHHPAYFPLQGDPRFEALLADPKNNEPLF